MNPTDIEDLVQLHAQRWTRSQPPPPPLDVAVRNAQLRRRPRIDRLAIAACVIAVLALAAIPVVRTFAQPRSASRPAAPSPQVLAKLTQIARSASAENGGAAVTAEAVHTTYLAAERAVLNGDTGSNPAATTPVWVVQIRGDFTCYSCRGPGRATPTGHVITLIVIAATLQSSDFGLGNQPHDLTSLGNVIPLNP